MLKIVQPTCCGINAHKKFVIATIASITKIGVMNHQNRPFNTFNCVLENSKAQLADNNCIEASMEFTGKYRTPVFNILEYRTTITLANPK